MIISYFYNPKPAVVKSANVNIDAANETELLEMQQNIQAAIAKNDKRVDRHRLLMATDIAITFMTAMFAPIGALFIPPLAPVMVAVVAGAFALGIFGGFSLNMFFALRKHEHVANRLNAQNTELKLELQRVNTRLALVRNENADGAQATVGQQARVLSSLQARPAITNENAPAPVNGNSLEQPLLQRQRVTSAPSAFARLSNRLSQFVSATFTRNPHTQTEANAAPQATNNTDYQPFTSNN